MIRFVFLIVVFINLLIANNEPLEKVSLQLHWKYQFEFAGFIAAKEKGFYKDVGLEVELKEYEFHHKRYEMFKDKTSEFFIFSTEIIGEQLKGLPALLVGSYFQRIPLAFATKKDIIFPSDLKNKKVMGTNNYKGNIIIENMFYSANLNFDDIKLIPHTFNIEDFISGKVDAIQIYVINELYELDKKKIPYNLIDVNNYGMEFNDIIVTTHKEFANENPETVKNFLEASTKGWQYALDNKEEIVDLILEKYNSQNKSKDALMFEAQRSENVILPNVYPLGSYPENKIQQIINGYKKLGIVDDVKLEAKDLVFKYKDNSKTKFTLKELQWLNKHPKIKVSNELDYPPFDFAVEGVPKGYSIDLLNLIAKNIGIDIDYVNGYTWNELVELFKDGKLDLLHSLTKTKKRQEYGLYSEPIIRYKTYIFTSKKNSDIKNIEQLFGKTIVVGKGWSIEDYLATKYPQINLLRVDNVEQMLLAVSKGEADAMINDKYSTLYDINRFHIDNIVQSSWFSEFDKNEFKSYHFMAQKDAPELISILNKALATIPEEEIRKLHRKYFGETQKDSITVLTKKQTAYLEDKGQITMCIDPDWMPYEKFDENGNHIGLSKDYFKIFQKNLNIPVRVIKTESWSQSLEYARKRKCDILSLAMETPIRKQYMNFTKPYLSAPLVLATKNEVSFVSNFQHLVNKKVGLVEGYAFNEILKDKYPELEIVNVKNIKDGLQQVVDNKLFGFVGSMADIGYIFQKEFVGELKIAGKFDEKWQLGVGVRNDDIMLLDIFQKLIDNISLSEHQSIFNKHIAIKYEKGTDYTLLWQISILFLIILAIVIFFSIRQNRLKNQLNTIFEQSLNPILLLDIETQQFIKFNQEALEMYGYTEDEFRNITTLDLSAEFTDIKQMKQKQKEILEKGFDSFTSKHKTKDGKILDVYMKTQVLDTNNRKIFYVTIDDISKQVENEKAIISYQKDLETKVKVEVEKNREKDQTIYRQSKLASMGEMIGNIAHQWRQPLNRVNLSLAVIEDLIEEDRLDKTLIHEKVKTAQNNILYMSDTIEDFANFFRPDKAIELFDIKNVLDKSRKLLGNRLDGIEFYIPDDSIVIQGYESELLQVILIIFNNALDNFVIKNIENKQIVIDLKESVTDIEIIITDNGGGINKEFIDNIFDPYFTTKFKGEGTGIGLYMAKMIIEDSMNGTLSVTSQNNCSSFAIKLKKLKGDIDE